MQINFTEDTEQIIQQLSDHASQSIFMLLATESELDLHPDISPNFTVGGGHAMF